MRRDLKSWMKVLTSFGTTNQKAKWRTRTRQVSSRKLRFENCEDRRMLATFTVNVDYDTDSWVDTDTEVSLREAIERANVFSPGPDTITFDSSVFGPGLADTISLTAGQLAITDSVTIDGQSLGITIDADQLSRIFEINAASSTVSVAGLTFTNGVGDNGGAINVNDAYGFHLVDCVFTSNTSNVNVTGGGAVHWTASSASEASGSIVGCYFGANKAEGVGVGGGLFISGGASNGTIAISNTEFVANEASRGGGVYVSGVDGNLTFDQVTVTNNTAGEWDDGQTISTDAGGGGIVLSYFLANVKIIDSTFDSNQTSRQGGGLWADYFYPATLSITGSTFVANRSYQHGGGLYVDNGVSPTGSDDGSEFSLIDSHVIENGTYVENQWTDYEGGYYSYSGFSGGGLYLKNAYRVLSTSAFSRIEHTEFSGNVAANGGGGIYAIVSNGNPLTVNNCSIIGNHALSHIGADVGLYGGGGVAIVDDYTIPEDSSLATFFQTTIAYNYAASGGGVYSELNWTKFSHCTITANIAGPLRYHFVEDHSIFPQWYDNYYEQQYAESLAQYEESLLQDPENPGPEEIPSPLAIAYSEDYTAGGGLWLLGFEDRADPDDGEVEPVVLDHTIVAGNLHYPDEGGELGSGSGAESEYYDEQKKQDVFAPKGPNLTPDIGSSIRPSFYEHSTSVLGYLYVRYSIIGYTGSLLKDFGSQAYESDYRLIEIIKPEADGYGDGVGDPDYLVANEYNNSSSLFGGTKSIYGSTYYLEGDLSPVGVGFSHNVPINWIFQLDAQGRPLLQGEGAQTVVPLAYTVDENGKGALAVDRGDPLLTTADIAYDQRGYARFHDLLGVTEVDPEDDGVAANQHIIDIGAYELQPPEVAGDYNYDGVVDVLDYVQWYNTQGLEGVLTSSEGTSGLYADGDNSGVVDGDDYDIWEANFPIPIQLGDYNRDGVVDLYLDWLLWRNTLGAEVVPYEGADGNGNGVIDSEDYLIWYANSDFSDVVIPHLPGDFNRDDVVDLADYVFWRNRRFSYVGQFSSADCNGDSYVDAEDYLLWRAFFGESTNYSSGAAFAEPIVFDAAPTVTNLTISGSQSVHDAYSFADEMLDASWIAGDQLRTVPVGAADTISITFSEDVMIEADDLSIIGLRTLNQPYLADPATDFTYDPITHIATWKLSGWVLGDQYAIRLSDSIVDFNGDALDGEWVNPTSMSSTATGVSSFANGSGNGVAGGSFQFVTTLLPGDANLDGFVDLSDYIIIQNNWGASVTLFTEGDLDGDGWVSQSDFNYVLVKWGTNLMDLLVIGDLDSDLAITNLDRDLLIANYGMSSPTVWDGDLDGDGDIDADDLAEYDATEAAFASFGLELLTA